jgi:heme oxygenase
LVRLLKEQTARTHRQVEHHLALLDPGLTTGRLTDVVRQLYGFWAGNEPSIARWSQTSPATASRLNCQRRQRTQVFTADLEMLGTPHDVLGTVPLAPPVFETIGHAEVFGWLYVTEGSTLGGSLINRRLQSSPDLTMSPLHCFAPYSEGPGPMWRSFGSALDDWALGHDDRTEAVAAAAVVTFDALHDWVTRCDGEVLA